MEELIPLISGLHRVLLVAGQSTLELPAIAVVGAQSVGKSSLLEAMVGKSFLPKGTGIVTRRPLILQLRYDKNATEYGEFAHKRGTIFEDFAKIEEEITSETERLLGKSKNVSNVPIFLKIVSSRVVDLTLIDLPGITKVPVGDQTDDIEQQIRTMIREYIVKPSCIILALTSANTDIATSDSLQMAREVDPEGLRTIGVITKCDMVEDNKSALDVLLGNIYKLHRGYVGVVCNGGTDDTSRRHTHEEEEIFFKNHAIYGPIANRCGVKHLSKMLNGILTLCIKDVLPRINSKVLSILQEKEAELNLYCFGGGDDGGSPGNFLLHFFTSYSQTYKQLVDGRTSLQQHSSQLFGGARINYIFNDSYAKTVMAFDPLHGLSDIEIRAAIRNSTGTNSALFVPEIAFSNLIKKQIRLLEKPSLQCVDQVYDEMLNILESCEVPNLERFVNLRSRIMIVIKDVLKRCMKPTKEMIKNIVKIELAYINTKHPDFLKSNDIANAYKQQETGNNKNSSNYHYQYDSRQDDYISPHQRTSSNSYSMISHSTQLKSTEMDGSMSQVIDGIDALMLPSIPAVVDLAYQPTEREVVEAELIKTLIKSYFSIVRKNIVDAVPKCIMCFMVNMAVDSVQQELICQLYRQELFQELTAESKDIIENREKCIETVKALKQCITDIKELARFRLDVYQTMLKGVADPNNWASLPFTVDGSEQFIRNFRDYSNLDMKKKHENRPLWACPDGYLYLEQFTNVSKQAQDFIATIAEPICRPEYVHEYQITVFSLHTAVSVGLTVEELLTNLSKFAKNKIPAKLKDAIVKIASAFGKIKLVLRDNRYWIESHDRKELDHLLTNAVIRSARIVSGGWGLENKAIDTDYITSAVPTADASSIVFNSNYTAGNPDSIEEDSKMEVSIDGIGKVVQEGQKTSQVYSFEVHQEKIEELKREALKSMRRPLVMEYDFRKDKLTPTLECCIRTNIKIRYYQERALRRMFSNGRARSGIIVLPCGAGKTLTGIVAACTVRKPIFVLTTSAVAVEQWIKQFLYFTNISSEKLLSLTSDNKSDLWDPKEAGVLISTYTMMAYSRKHREATENILNQIKQRDWGLLIFDEVQFVPAPAFRRINEIVRSHCKLGLTATLVREDDLIKDLQWLIGPKLYEANWIELQERGYLAKIICKEIWCPMTAPFYREYLRSDWAKKRRLWSCNPVKLATCEYLLKFHEARGDKVIVFSDNLFALLHVAKMLHRPFIYGKVTSAERIVILNKFKNENTFNSIILSKVGDNALDIPCANVVIQISFNFASRRQEAQRLGRILRPKSKTDENGFNSFFYSLVSKDTQEMVFADKRQQFIIDQGYAYNVTSSSEVVKDWSNLLYNKPEVQQELLQDIISASYEDDVEADDQMAPGEADPQSMPADKLMETQVKRTSLSKMSISLHKRIMKKHLPAAEPKKRSTAKKLANQHPMFRKFFSGKK